MGPDGSFADRLRMAALVWVDALTYALAVAALATVGGFSVGVATGGGLVGAKVALFLVGFGLLGYATFRLWPSSPADFEDGRGVGGDPTGSSVPKAPDETRFQALVLALPPLRWLPTPPPDARLTPPGKLFLGSLFVLAVSFLMETVFGIA